MSFRSSQPTPRERCSKRSTAQYPKWFQPLEREDGANEVEVDGIVIARRPADGAFYDQTYFPYEDDYPSDYSKLPDAMNKVLWQTLVHSLTITSNIA